MADKQSHPSFLCQCWHQHTHWQQQSTSTVSLHEGIISCERAGTCVLILIILPSQQCFVPLEKKGLALLKPTDKAFLTTVHKGPFIPTVPKIAIGRNHELNTWLWIPLNHCLLTQTRNQCPAVASSPVVLVLNSAVKCWLFLSHPVLVPSFLKVFRSLEFYEKFRETAQNSTNPFLCTCKTCIESY